MTNEYKGFRLTEENIHEYFPYKTEYHKKEYEHGKMYTYEAVEPYTGLVLTIASDGFGCGESDSYIVLNVNKKPRAKHGTVEMALVVKYDEKSKKVWYIDDRKHHLTQTGDKSGTWKWLGDTPPYCYFVWWGQLSPHDEGFALFK